MIESNSLETAVAKKVSILDYFSIGEFLNEFVVAQRKKDRGFSFRALARKLKPCSPSLVTMVARGERLPTDKFVGALAVGLKFNAKEKAYAFKIAAYQRAPDTEAKLFHLRELQKISPKFSRVDLAQSQEAPLSNWYYFAIFEMIGLKGFENDPEKIAKLLGAGVTPDKVQHAIDLLLRTKFLDRTTDGKLIKVPNFVDGLANTPSHVFRQYHKQVIQRAFTSVDSKSIDDRFLSSNILAIPEDRYEKAKEMILEFRDRFFQEISVDNSQADDVFYLSIQFFNALDKERGKPAFLLN